MKVKSTGPDPDINENEQSHPPTITSKEFQMNPTALAYLAAGIGAGVTVIGAGIGIGKLAAAAMEASGRQPEVVGQVRTSMLIAAALIEGATFFALAICII